MNVERLRVPKREARELYKKYKKHQHYSAPMDREIQRAYQLIAQGRLVIRALESIKTAGLGDDGLPKLAICRADFSAVHCRVWGQGKWQNSAGCQMTASPTPRQVWQRGKQFSIPGFAAPADHSRSGEAAVPIIPVHLRPKRGLQNYHVLWEAVWRKVPPYDPMLLRRIGGDMWLVVAAWDLTEVERAAMATRLNA